MGKDTSVDKERVLRDAEEFGVERAAARHQVGVRTIKRWRAIERERTGPASRSPVAEAARDVAAQIAAAPVGEDWSASVGRAVCVLAARSCELAAQAGPDDLRTLTEATVKLAHLLSQREIMLASATAGVEGKSDAGRPDRGDPTPRATGEVPPGR